MTERKLSEKMKEPPCGAVIPESYIKELESLEQERDNLKEQLKPKNICMSCGVACADRGIWENCQAFIDKSVTEGQFRNGLWKAHMAIVKKYLDTKAEVKRLREILRNDK